MAKPFDVTTKHLVEAHPDDWVACLGLPPGPTRVLDAEVSTISAEADRVINVTADDHPYLLHVEFQSGLDPDIPARLARYNLLLWYTHRLPVASVVVLLRRGADSLRFTGRLSVPDPSASAADPPYLEFRYRVLRVWEQAPETFLAAGLGTLPLAPLAAVSAEQVPDIVRRMESRLAEAAAPLSEAQTLWTSTYVLMGLRFSPQFAQQVLQGVMQMRESSTYQFILDEGRQEGRQEGQLEEARRLILRQGTRRFGAPDAATETALAALRSVERLEQLAERLLEAESWAELLA